MHISSTVAKRGKTIENHCFNNCNLQSTTHRTTSEVAFFFLNKKTAKKQNRQKVHTYKLPKFAATKFKCLTVIDF